MTPPTRRLLGGATLTDLRTEASPAAQVEVEASEREVGA